MDNKIVFLQDNKAYVAIGDLQGLILNFTSGYFETMPSSKLVPFTSKERDHNSDICSNTLAFLTKKTVALVTANPTQTKDIGFFEVNTKKFIVFY